MHRAAGLVAVVSTVSLTAGALCGPGTAAAAPVRCSKSGGTTLASSAKARVFYRDADLYSCWLPTRRRTLLGELEATFPPHDGVAVQKELAVNAHVDGEFVGFSLHYAPEGGEEAIVLAVNARTGRRRRRLEVPQQFEESGLVSSIEDLGVAADGSLVYEQVLGSPCKGHHDGPPPCKGCIGARNAALVAVEPGDSHRLLDCELSSEPEGSISGLRVSGQTVTWQHGGEARSDTLR